MVNNIALKTTVTWKNNPVLVFTSKPKAADNEPFLEYPLSSMYLCFL